MVPILGKLARTKYHVDLNKCQSDYDKIRLNNPCEPISSQIIGTAKTV